MDPSFTNIFDGASCASIVFGATLMPLSVAKTPPVENKRAGLARIGESRKTRWTPGVIEIGQFEGEMSLSDWEISVLSRAPLHGLSLYLFPVIVSFDHPSIFGSVAVLIDDCSFSKIDAVDVTGGSEEAVIQKFALHVGGAVWHKGRSGLWTTLGFEKALPSDAARVIMEF